MNPLKEELLEITQGARLTLTETYDRSLGIPKSFTELYTFHKKEFPNYPVEKPPQGPDIAILSFSTLPSHQHFLSMLQKALEMTFQKEVRLLNKSGWESAKMVIAPDYGISSDPNLAKLFKDGDKKGRSFLGEVPLFLLCDLSLYQKEPKQKRSLWKALCQEIVSLKLPKSS